jgi:murein DD-endopeptidase MepM/ murein hydrolase activator NlpD
MKIAFLFLMAGLSACGSAGGSVDPLVIFNDTAIPSLDSIVTTSSSLTSVTITPYTNSAPYWVFNNAGVFNGGNFIAPAKGIVTRVGVVSFNGSTPTAVTIIHSGRLATKVIGMQVVQVREGDSVSAGQIIGSFVTTGSVGFQVILDGTAVCPLSFMSSTFRQYFSTGGLFGSVNLCQN